MIAWAGFILSLFSLAIWAFVLYWGHRLYVQVKPMLGMFGLPAGLAAKSPSPAGPAESMQCDFHHGSEGDRCQFPAGHEGPHSWAASVPDRRGYCNAPPDFHCPTPDYCSREGCQY